MSKEVSERIVLKAKEDTQFMQQLLRNPKIFLKDYDLTDVERSFFENADEATLMGLSSACFNLVTGKK